MLRIGQVEPTATSDGKYTDGNVAGGTPATRLRAPAFNALQEELANIVESAGMTLDPNNMTQVLTALKKLLPISGRLLNVRTFTSSANFTPTPGMTFSIVEVQGAGGGSGGVPATGSSSVGASGAGGSGAYAKGIFTAVQIGSSQAVTIGVGGAAGTAGGGDGGTGGTSSFGSLIVCPGGNGGGSTGSTAISFPTSRGGSTETTAPTGGNIISTKGKAGAGSTVVNGSVGNLGTGAASPYSAGGTGGDGENGSGAGGLVNLINQPARAGFNGGKGFVTVCEYA
nr:MAG TPA: tail fiber protein [Caudoviricetes sp.]